MQTQILKLTKPKYILDAWNKGPKPTNGIKMHKEKYENKKWGFTYVQSFRNDDRRNGCHSGEMISALKASEWQYPLVASFTMVGDDGAHCGNGVWKLKGRDLEYLPTKVKKFFHNNNYHSTTITT